MAYGKDAYRRAVAGEAGRRFGVNPDFERIFQSQKDALLEAETLAALPVDATDYAPIQDASGALFFMPDRDAPDVPFTADGTALVLA